MNSATNIAAVAANSNASVAESKHDSDRDLADVAKDVRADIAAAIKSGALPAGLKCSVRLSRFSMGQSLSVYVREVPAAFVVLSLKKIRHDLTSPHVFSELPRYTPEASAVLAKLERIMAAYNRDRSDSQSDHFDVAFYQHAGFDTGLERVQRTEIEGAIRAAS